MEQWLLPAGVTDADGLQQREVPVPVPEPGPGEVRIRVRGVSINARDSLILAGPFGRVEGRDLVALSDVAGEVDAVGDGLPPGRSRTASPTCASSGPRFSTQRPGRSRARRVLEDAGVLAEYVVPLDMAAWIGGDGALANVALERSAGP